MSVVRPNKDRVAYCIRSKLLSRSGVIMEANHKRGKSNSLALMRQHGKGQTHVTLA